MGVLTGLISLALLASAVTGQPTAPAARWVSRWDQGECQLIRAIDDSQQIGIRVIPGSGFVALWVFPPDGGPAPASARMRSIVTIEPAGATLRSESVSRYRRADKTFYVINFDDAALSALEQATALQVDVNDRRIVDLSLRSTSSAINILRQCMNDQLRAWGMDPNALAALWQPPRPLHPNGLAGYFSSADYPSRALQAGRSGLTVARLDVDRQGRVERCAVLTGSGESALDMRTCSIFSRRARFDPAIDASGNPVASSIVSSVNWLVLSGGSPF